MILAFAHPGIVVTDLEKAIAFYTAMFGFEALSEEGWQHSEEADRAVGLKNSASRGCMMRGHNCFLELWEYLTPLQSTQSPARLGANELGIRHLAFYVDDCRKEYQRLLRLGGEKLGEPVGDAGNNSVVYCRDPFGNIIELCEIPIAEENPTSLAGVTSLSKFVG